jgi:hypothetical protein
MEQTNKAIIEADKTYNGWTNYETWNYKLWIDNDAGSYNNYITQAKKIMNNSIADKTFTKKENAKFTLMAQLKNECEENNPLNDNASTYSDMLNAAISEINFYEIASNIIDDLENN